MPGTGGMRGAGGRREEEVCMGPLGVGDPRKLSKGRRPWPGPAPTLLHATCRRRRRRLLRAARRLPSARPMGGGRHSRAERRGTTGDKEDGEPKTKQLREGEEEGEKHRELRLRNYVPEDEDLKKRRVPQAKPVAVEEKVKEQLEAAKPEPVIEEVDLANLAPRKPDWDLKRDVAKKLEKLEKRTQRAIAELIRERLKGQEDNLASAVANTTPEQEADDSD
ncbi:coiled-coil domain-containing protein 12-like [Hippopotamus amphibius kiboko]|uniref:coiled-coil domain-containing protein 12-like n=1 Tax=Hippopotamus amphibius kiboko TaxID=575201 RepID=UPI00259412C5|nr:coiled-coil domain-containing protein 12-like [Hippopotamus amphibius kiboko]